MESMLGLTLRDKTRICEEETEWMILLSTRLGQNGDKQNTQE